ncbi:uncharacterized protein C8orf48 [Amia ocellicauda]|uniref:uncharacterized protein C8orf48 n=1 Tax=Amia ocellicauda TaxID=2972642 RepID=UPI003463C895
MTSETEDAESERLSGNYGDASFESWPRCRSREDSVGGYSRDSFDSFRSGDGFDPPAESTAKHRASVTGPDEFEPQEENESTAEELRGKWVRVLRGKASLSGAAQNRRSDSRPHRDVSKLGPEEKDALSSYCRRKIRVVQQPQRAPPSGGRGELSRRISAGRAAPGESAGCVVPPPMVSRLKLKSLVETMKQAVAVDMHDPGRCGPCLHTRAALARNAFIRTKKTRLDTVLLQDKFEEAVFTKDPICLIGEILRDLPKLSDDPSEIWRALTTQHKCSPPRDS